MSGFSLEESVAVKSIVYQCMEDNGAKNEPLIKIWSELLFLYHDSCATVQRDASAKPVFFTLKLAALTS